LSDVFETTIKDMFAVYGFGDYEVIPVAIGGL
jgi:hypothetical protein